MKFVTKGLAVASKPIISSTVVIATLVAFGAIYHTTLHSQIQRYLGKKITRIDFIGNKHTSKSDMYDLVQMRPGMALSQGLLNGDIKALFSEGAFAHVKVEAEPYKGGVSVVFIVLERPLITDIEFLGINELNEQEISDALPLKEDEVYSDKKVAESIQIIVAKYHEEGFFNAIVKVRKSKIDPKENTIEVTFMVDEGEEIKISKINLIGVRSVDPEDLLSIMELEEDGFIADGTFQEGLFEKDKDTLIQFYKSQGYLDAEINGRWDLRWKNPRKREERVINITYVFKEGEQYFFNGYDVEWDEKFLNKETKKPLFTRDRVFYFFEYTNDDVGSIFDFGRFARDRGIINYLYSQQGYIFARVIPERTTIKLTKEEIAKLKTSAIQKEAEKEGRDYYNIKALEEIYADEPEKRNRKFVHTKFIIAENDKGFIENIIVKGNKKTLDKVIRRELLVVEGELFNAARVQRSRERIFNLGFFKEVNVDARPGSAEGKMNLIIDVEEQPTGTISLGGGFGTQTGFSIFTEVAENNLNGTGQRVSGRVEFGPLRTAIEASWTEPWLFDKPWSLTLSGFYIKRQILAPALSIANQEESSTYERDSVGTSVQVGHRLDNVYLFGYRLLNWGHFHRFSPVFSIASNPTSMVDDTVFLLVKQGWQVKNTLTNGLFYDNRDNVFNTTTGWRWDWSVDVVGSVLGGNDHFNRYNVSSQFYWWPLDYTFFNLIRKNILRRWRIVFEHRFSAAFTHETSPVFSSQNRAENPFIEVEDRLYIGGFESLRGWNLFDINYPTAWRDGGSHRLLFGTELRMPVEPSLFWLVLFFDAGALYDNFSEQNFDRNTPTSTIQAVGASSLVANNLALSYWRYSWGFGFRLQIPILPLRIYLARKLIFDPNRGWFRNLPNDSDFQFVFGIGDRRF